MLILDEVLRSIPLGYIPNNTDENLVENIKYHIERSGMLGLIEDRASGLLERIDEPSFMKECIEFLTTLSEI